MGLHRARVDEDVFMHHMMGRGQRTALLPTTGSGRQSRAPEDTNAEAAPEGRCLVISTAIPYSAAMFFNVSPAIL